MTERLDWLSREATRTRVELMTTVVNGGKTLIGDYASGSPARERAWIETS